MKQTLLLCPFLLFIHFLSAQTWTYPGGGIIYTTGSPIKVGIGTSNPQANLDVVGYNRTEGTLTVDEQQVGAIGAWIRGAASGNANIVMHANAGGGNAIWITGDPYTLKIGGIGGTEPSQGMINCMFGNTVGINTTDTKGYTFAVAGSAIFTQAVVKAQANWPDYVFKKGFRLPSLREVDRYIRSNGHLPGFPSAAEVEKSGIDLGPTTTRLLEKVEQLTLYSIDLQKQVDRLKAENEKLADLQQQIDQLKKLLSTK